MKTKVKKQWVKALKSGKYKQGKGSLRGERDFCCLGVLCDIYIKENKKRWTGFRSLVHLPKQVVEWAGLSEKETLHDDDALADEFNVKIGRKNLADMNDGGATFETIAKLIEKKL